MVKYVYEKGEGNSEKINPILIEKAIGFFLENQMMGDIVPSGEIQKEYLIPHNLRTDFVVGDTCIETKVLMRNGKQAGASLGNLLHLLASNKKNYNILQEHYKRVVLLVICEEDMYEQIKASSFSEGWRRNLDKELNQGVEVWISEIRIEADGIVLKSYQKIAPSD